jgi:hypothetical protein
MKRRRKPVIFEIYLPHLERQLEVKQGKMGFYKGYMITSKMHNNCSLVEQYCRTVGEQHRMVIHKYSFKFTLDDIRIHSTISFTTTPKNETLTPTARKITISTSHTISEYGVSKS